MGAPTLAETGIVLTARLGKDARGLPRGLCREWAAEMVTFGEEHWREGVAAHARVGRGRCRAGLNFGECMAYAVARLSGEPRLSTGDDFPKTDPPLA